MSLGFLLVLIIVPSTLVNLTNAYLLGDGTSLCFADTALATGTAKSLIECPPGMTLSFQQIPDLDIAKQYTLASQLTVTETFFETMCGTLNSCRGLTKDQYLAVAAQNLPSWRDSTTLLAKSCDDSTVLYDGVNKLETLKTPSPGLWKGYCMFHHINAHSCPSIDIEGNAKLCKPYVPNKDGFATHSPVQTKLAWVEGGVPLGDPNWKIHSNVTFPIFLDPSTSTKDFMTIAHYRIGELSIAAGWGHKVNNFLGRTQCPTTENYEGVPNPNGSCAPCPLGYFGVNKIDNGVTAVPPNPAGLVTTMHSLTLANKCFKCPAGEYNDISSVRLNSTGHLNEVTPGAAPMGRNSCKKCPAGQYQDEMGQEGCKTCAPGTVQDLTGEKGCLQCQRGYYQPAAGQSKCLRSGVGYYVPTQGATAQIACPTGLTTKGEARLSVAECICVENTYFDGKGCSPCPKGFICHGGLVGSGAATRHKMPVLKKNYWSDVTVDPHLAYYCQNDKRCPGGKEPSQYTSSDDLCAENMTGVNCGKCATDYFPSKGGGSCQKCSALQPILFGCLVIIFFTGLGFVYRLANSRLTVELSPTLSFSIAVGVTVSMLQSLGLLSSNMALDWPSPLKEIMAFMKLFVFDLQMVGPECALGASPVGKLLTRQLVPLLIVVVYVGGGVLLKLDRQKVCNSMGMLFVGVFAAVAAGAFSPFSCYDNPSGVRTMLMMPYVKCDAEDSDWVKMAIIGGITTCLYPIAGLAYITYAVMISPTKGHDAEWVTAHRFLLFRFRLDRFYWMPFYLLRNTSITLPQMFIESAHAQAIAIVFILFIFLILQIFVWPWRSTRLNRFDAFSTCMVILIVYCWFPTSDVEVSNRQSYAGLSTIFVSLLFGGMVFMLARSAHDVYLAKIGKAMKTTSSEMHVRGKLKALVKRWRKQPDEDIVRDLEYLYKNLSPIDYANFFAMVTAFELTIGTENRDALMQDLSISQKRVILGRDRSHSLDQDEAKLIKQNSKISDLLFDK